jgi:hypothetical protein
VRLFAPVELSSGQAAVWELTVAQVRQLLHQGGEISLASVVEVCPDCIRVEGGIGDEGLAAIWEAFTRLNASVFEPPRKSARKTDPAKTAKRAAHVLDLNCLAFAKAGHANIWNYGYRLYSLLCEETKKAAHGG